MSSKFMMSPPSPGEAGSPPDCESGDGGTIWKNAPDVVKQETIGCYNNVKTVHMGRRGGSVG